MNPYEPPRANLERPSPEPSLVYAGFWIRVGASLIDTLLIMAVTLPLLLWVYGTAYFGPETSGLIAGPADFLISWVLPAIAVVLLWVYRSATPGKMAVSAKIVDARTGGRPSTGRLMGRYLGYYVSLIPLGLGFLWVAFDRRKQGWHDKLAGTLVVRERRGAGDPVRFDRAV